MLWHDTEISERHRTHFGCTLAAICRCAGYRAAGILAYCLHAGLINKQLCTKIIVSVGQPANILVSLFRALRRSKVFFELLGRFFFGAAVTVFFVEV